MNSASTSRSRRGLQVLLVAGLALALGVWISQRLRPLPPAAPGGALVLVSDQECAACHAPQSQEWAASHHAKAMQAASRDTVLGRFDGPAFQSRKTTWRFFMRDGRFFVNTPNAGGQAQDFEIKYTFGVNPLQQYLVELPGGRLQALTVAWDARAAEKGGQRWYDLYPDQDISPGDPLHWTGRYQNWNLMCAQCHVTDFHKGYDASADTYRSTYKVGNVGCQACHGPGSRHVEWARATPHLPGSDKGLAVDFHAHDSRYQVDACAACHSRRSDLADPAAMDAPLLDSYQPVTLREGLYHPDGQQQGEVYAYGSFRQSRMYQMGVRCTDCHRAHGGGMLAEGNKVCAQCHNPLGNPRFATAPKKEYDTPEHHHHKPGISCAGCHMPTTTYMGVHERPDHAIRIPRPDLTVSLGVPNACNKCHADKTAAWSVEWSDKWYGEGWRKRPQFATLFASARRGDASAGSALAALATDSTWPAIVRATAFELLSSYAEVGPAAKAGVGDPDPVVRAAAASAMRGVAPEARIQVLAPLLDDRIRAVRIEAARQLAAAREQMDGKGRAKLDAGLAEYEKAQMAMADMPSAHLNIGAMYGDLGQPQRAVAEYEAALRLDPFFLPATFNLANACNAMGKNADAERVLRDGLKRAPNEGELYYSLGLLLGEENRLDDASAALGRAAALLPDRATVQYNYGLSLMQLGKADAAERALLLAQRLDPADRKVLYGLSAFYAQRGEWDKARPPAERLVSLDPADPQAKALLDRIRARR